MYFVYVLQSKKDGGWYIGFMNNFKRRIVEHNKGKIKSTARRGFLSIIYFEGYIFKSDALGREKFLKSGAGRNFLKRQLIYYLSQSI